MLDRLNENLPNSPVELENHGVAISLNEQDYSVRAPEGERGEQYCVFMSVHLTVYCLLQKKKPQ